MVTKVGVVIPVLNQFKMAIDCIASIDYDEDIHVEVVPNYRLGLPLSAAWNIGAQACFDKGCHYVLIVNDDILLNMHTIGNMVKFFRETECVLVTAHNMRGLIEPDAILNTVFDEDASFYEAPDFSCFMITESTLTKVGLFDASFTPAYFEDNDYHRRIILGGYKAFKCMNAKFYHYGSQTQNSVSNGIVTSPMFDKNRNHYVEKWGGVPGEEKFEHPYNDRNLSFKQVRLP